MQLVLATNNQGKLKEIKDLFTDTHYNIISLKDLGFEEDIEENGRSFEENAFIKADVIFNRFNLPVIADDSGLEVEQLDGEPGIYSARYAGENVTYEENNLKLIKELTPFAPPHLAQFICCAVYIDSVNRISVIGKLEGEIIRELRGKYGFGFDPLFKPNGYNSTLAELPFDEKNRISHRFKAFSLLKEKIKNKK